MADLSQLKPAEIILKIKHPATGRLTGVTVTIMSMFDERMKSFVRQIQDQRLRLEARGKHFKSEEIEDNGIELAFRAMTDWHWGTDEDGEEATFKGKKPEFDKATVKQVLTELPWFKNQIDVAISEEKDFFQR
ncbi:hypothetical protein P106B_29 [Rhizobium phage vB_RglS_P106B]|uniref:Tail assembly chaperone n=1 Tax=Rhizobium phage vB_RglS_P106B TaxID=1458697 RepID=W6EC11_9CAUD|nr:hypothetical protein P106B_29 [Rhizobium phage vB_RglS_P106B]AHJ10712.1 hypothetical protein P106B_29 [Rhizobium phage vB_RglS_P106B]